MPSRAEPPETRYATSGDLRIAYQVLGDGPIDLVYAPGFVSHLDLQWGDPDLSRCMRRIASFSRLILFDKRGTGLSDPTPRVPTLEERIDDIRAVVDAVGSDRFALFGFSEGAAMSLMFAATYPERVNALALFGPVAWPRADDPQPWRDWAEQRMAGIAEVVENWGEGRLLRFMCPGTPQTELGRRLTGVLERAAASPAMARALVEAIKHLDYREILPAVSQPTLFIVRKDDVVVPSFATREFAARVPDSKVVELEGTDHWWWLGNAERVVDELEEFLTGARHEQSAERALATVLFTDIADSTTTAAKLGDQTWRRLLERHDAIVREEVARFRGRTVKSTGDGFLVAFDGPARGIECATAIIARAAMVGLLVRAGLHTGECEVIGDDLGGMAVHIGARVSSAAQPGEVLVSRTVRDLVVGSNLRFASRGPHELKGVPDSWELFQVVERRAEDLEPDEAAVDARATRTQRVIISLGRRYPGAVARAIAWSRRGQVVGA